MIAKATFAAMALAIAATSFTAAAQAGSYSDNQARINRLHRDARNGGPVIVGSDSPYLARLRVCQYLNRPVYDPRRDRYVRVRTKTCWWTD